MYVDGFCFLNAIVPKQGDSIASSAVHGGGGGQLFGALKISFDLPDQVVGTTPLAVTEPSGRVLQFPYHLGLMNPMTAPEVSALIFFSQDVAGRLSMNASVLTREYMTMAAKFALAQDFILSTMRMICQLIYELDNQASWANILACHSFSGSNFREKPNVYG